MPPTGGAYTLVGEESRPRIPRETEVKTVLLGFDDGSPPGGRALGRNVGDAVAHRTRRDVPIVR